MKFAHISQKGIWIFCILLAGLIVASFLGNMVEGFVVASDTSGNTTNYATHSQFGSSSFSGTTDQSGNTQYDNYNHYSGTSSNALISGQVFYGPNGGQAVVITGADGKMVLKVTLPNDPTPVIYSYVTVNQWQGSNGTATLVQSSDGSAALKITLNNGQTYIFTVNAPTPYMQSQPTTSEQASNDATVYYGSTGSPPPSSQSYYAYDQPTTTGGAQNDYKQQYYNQPTTGATDAANSNGITRSQIPAGQEDLYVLKSSCIPPVCPAPVVYNTCENNKPPPPCPPCARCESPNFECKKVPNYSQANTTLPVPILADFSQFGM